MTQTFVKQADIAITDLHPEYGKRYRPEGLNKQDRYLFGLHSRLLACPCCKAPHTVNELLFNSPDKSPTHERRLYCPPTGKEVGHGMGLFGGDEWLYEKD